RAYRTSFTVRRVRRDGANTSRPPAGECVELFLDRATYSGVAAGRGRRERARRRVDERAAATFLRRVGPRHDPRQVGSRDAPIAGQALRGIGRRTVQSRQAVDRRGRRLGAWWRHDTGHLLRRAPCRPKRQFWLSPNRAW